MLTWVARYHVITIEAHKTTIHKLKTIPKLCFLTIDYMRIGEYNSTMAPVTENNESDKNSITLKKSINQDDHDLGTIELQPVSSCGVGESAGMTPDALPVLLRDANDESRV